MRRIRNYILMALGFACLLLALVGIALPVIPGVPFAIAAAFLFSRSSARAHRWLLALPHLGEAIRDWDEQGVIRLRSKIISSAMIASTMIVFSLVVDVGLVFKVALIAILSGVVVFIVTRPGDARQPARIEE